LFGDHFNTVAAHCGVNFAESFGMKHTDPLSVAVLADNAGAALLRLTVLLNLMHQVSLRILLGPRKC